MKMILIIAGVGMLIIGGIMGLNQADLNKASCS